MSFLPSHPEGSDTPIHIKQLQLMLIMLIATPLARPQMMMMPVSCHPSERKCLIKCSQASTLGLIRWNRLSRPYKTHNRSVWRRWKLWKSKYGNRRIVLAAWKNLSMLLLKVDDLEERLLRNNIKILCIPEKQTNWICQDPIFETSRKRNLPYAADNRWAHRPLWPPCTIIARVYYYCSYCVLEGMQAGMQGQKGVHLTNGTI